MKVVAKIEKMMIRAMMVPPKGRTVDIESAAMLSDWTIVLIGSKRI